MADASPVESIDPQSAYERLLEQHSQRTRALEQRSRALSVARFVAMVAVAILLWLAVQSRAVSILWVLVPGAVFLSLLPLHEKVLRRAERSARAVLFYRQGLERLAGNWVGVGAGGERFSDQVASHPYAGDLDLFGRGSLFEFVSRCSTVTGEDTLAEWLLRPASPHEIEMRQAAISELVPELPLRQRLATLRSEVRQSADSTDLLAWAQASSELRSHSAWRVVALFLGTLNVAAALAWWPLGQGPTALLILGLVEVLLFLAFRKRLAGMVTGVERSARELEELVEVLSWIRDSQFESDWLRERHATLQSQDAGSAVEQIQHLRRLVELHDSMRNPFFAPFGLLLLWGPQTALAIDSWRARSGEPVGQWLRVLGELEASSSLAGLAYEQPDYTMPVVHSEEQPVRFVARGLGHPLLPAGRRCEVNDITIGRHQADVPPGFVISGSNMSGKSTFLRACGVNCVLALSGAPVRARSLELTPLAIGASIQIQDSLLEGSSKFYSEITRLRSILELTNSPLPVLFLLDEILHGTNSHDRRIGAAAVVRALLRAGAIGLVTTHDLALARLAEDDEGQATDETLGALRNHHFVDTLENGKITFDYQLREGVVTRSNALALMREIGLDV